MRGTFSAAIALVLAIALAACSGVPVDADGGIGGASPAAAAASPGDAATDGAAPAASLRPAAATLTDAELAAVPYFALHAGLYEDPASAITLWENWRAGVAAQRCMEDAGFAWLLEVRDLGVATAAAVEDLGYAGGDPLAFLRAPFTSPAANDARLRDLGHVRAFEEYRAYYGDALVDRFADFGMGFEQYTRPSTSYWNADAYPGGCYARGLEELDVDLPSEALAQELATELAGVRETPELAQARAAFTVCVRGNGLDMDVDPAADGDIELAEELPGGYDAVFPCLTDLSDTEAAWSDAVVAEFVAAHADTLRAAAAQAADLRDRIDADAGFAAFLEELSQGLVEQS
ncbi:hypothetical protein [Demequina iriomotensis]|uniref:hypothetical protein n=1 Tax=Demequina iriomotensis TaxID=1536641 RepID=UPI000785F169|nr:hypothetical protein [Demequina iriomotensis]